MSDLVSPFDAGYHFRLIARPGLFQELVPAGAVTVIAVAERIFFIIILVIILGRVEIAQRQDLGCDRFAEPAGGGETLLGSLGQVALLIGGIEYDAAVLGAAVHELAARIRGVHVAPEHLQQLRIGHLVRVVDHLHGLDVAAAAGRDLLVGGVGSAAAGVA